MVAEVYDALISAGADDAKARRAAEVLTEFDDRFERVERRFDGVERRIDGVERRIDLLETRMDSRFAHTNGRIDTLEAKVDGKFVLLYGMFGVLVTMTSAIILKLFIPS